MDLIMAFGSVLFFILFSFLVFVFIVFFRSLFVKKEYSDFEPFVDIVIPVYNEERNIASCLDSIYNSNYPKEKMKVNVVDDGSTDKTADIVRGYKDVEIIKQAHLGKTEALNKGVIESCYGFILTVDADTILDKECIREIVKPFTDEKVGAVTGAIKVKNHNKVITAFQNIEYHYNNLIRSSFSKVFENGVWFFGALACYRKSIIEKVGYFKKDTPTEDMDIALEIKKLGYKTISLNKANCHTVVPETLKGLYKQRSRWWIGGLKSLMNNRTVFSIKDLSILFLFVNQFWWSFYALASLPLIIYQIY